ncbi:MAG: D-2-hydroxyacid dehydrogenase [Oscillospiraceae bacterium]
MLKIVILDGFTTTLSDLNFNEIGKLGDLTVYDRTPTGLIFERTKDADIVITNKTPLKNQDLDKMKNLKFIALMSTGCNIVDYEYARKIGISVSNIPSYSTSAVAQLTFALILEITNGVALHNLDVKNGKWSQSQDFCFFSQPILELSNKTIGIIGFGQIGMAVADIATAFRMNVLAFSGHKTNQSSRKNFKWASLDELLIHSDIISLHCPLNSKTIKMVNKEFLNKCKKNPIIINTSRGQVIDEYALADALKSGQIKAAGLDVLSSEPPRSDNPLLNLENCFITPHIAWGAVETRARLIKILTENVKAFINGNEQNVIN